MGNTVINNVILVIKKNEILPFVTTWMDQEGVMLSEISHTKKDRYRMVSLICGIYKTKQMNKHNKTETET